MIWINHSSVQWKDKTFSLWFNKSKKFIQRFLILNEFSILISWNHNSSLRRWVSSSSNNISSLYPPIAILQFLTMSLYMLLFTTVITDNIIIHFNSGILKKCHSKYSKPTSSITLLSVLSLSKLAFNMISMNKFTKYLNCCITFFPNHCIL